MSQQRKKIFLDSSLWQHKWFDALPLEYQMSWILLNILSDNIGVWEPNIRALNFHLKQELDVDGFLKAVNEDQERIEILSDGRWWLRDYLPLQVKTLTPNNPPHVSYLELLKEHGLLKKYVLEYPEYVNLECILELKNSPEEKHQRMYSVLKSKGLARVLEGLCHDSKDKEKDKEQERELEENIPPNGSKKNNRGKDLKTFENFNPF